MPETTPIEMFVEGDLIILKKYAPDCIFCGEVDQVVNYKGKNVCSKCLGELKVIK